MSAKWSNISQYLQKNEQNHSFVIFMEKIFIEENHLNGLLYFCHRKS